MAAAKIQMIERTLDIMEVLAQEARGLNLTDIAQRVNLPKSTVYRILNALIDRNYIVKKEDGHKYKLALKIVNLASNMLYALDLRTEAYPCLQTLADETRQTIHLAVWQGDAIVYLDKIEAYQRLAISSALGRTLPIHCTGLGKVLLAYMPAERREEIIQKLDFHKFTENTNINPAHLREELFEARKNGYAVDNEEHEENIFCVATPILNYTNKIIAAVSITGQVSYFEQNGLFEIIKTIQDVGLKISKRMGYQGEKIP